MHDPDDDADDRALEGAVGLEDVKRVGAKSSFQDFQYSCHAKKRKVSGIVAEALELATELVNKEAPADSSPSTKLVPVKSSLTTAQAEAKKVQDHPCSSSHIAYV